MMCFMLIGMDIVTFKGIVALNLQINGCQVERGCLFCENPSGNNKGASGDSPAVSKRELKNGQVTGSS